VKEQICRTLEELRTTGSMLDKRKYKTVMLTEKDVEDTSMDIETTPRKFMCQWCVKILSPHSNKTFAILYKIRSTQLFL